MTTALVNRRRVLLGGLAIGASVALAGAVWLPRPAKGLKVLSGPEVKVVEAIALVMFPGDPMPLNGVEAGVVARVDAILEDDVTDAARIAFRYLLRAVEWGPVATRGGRFTDLSPDHQHEVLTAWSEPGLAPRRIAFDAVKMVMGMAYFGNPEIQAHIGWRNACSGGMA